MTVPKTPAVENPQKTSPRLLLQLGAQDEKEQGFKVGKLPLFCAPAYSPFPINPSSFNFR